jgi:hypothetical protein
MVEDNLLVEEFIALGKSYSEVTIQKNSTEKELILRICTVKCLYVLRMQI